MFSTHQRGCFAIPAAAVRNRFQYGYDRNSNRLWRENAVNTAFGEVYQYDNLNQITSFKRGTLNAGKTDVTGTASRTQTWDFDALGNFDGVTTDGNSQTRSHNKQNEITSISSATTPTYDANGNLTKDETGRTFEYDAWNRLVRVKNSAGTTIWESEYDALFRRVSTTESGTTTDFYFSDQWQVLEERVSGAAKVQYVWSPVYVDALVLRDRDVTGDSALEERLWVMQDANYNVTALYDGSGNVVERYAYDPFGAMMVYDGNWGARSGSGYAFNYGLQGRPYDSVTGTYDSRRRSLYPTLGRFGQLDPIGIVAGDTNFYRFEGNGPVNRLDPSGLDSDPFERGPYGWIASITLWYYGRSEMRKPIPRDSYSGTETVKDLAVGDSMRRDNKLWADDTTHQAPLVIGSTMILVGSIFLPGPEDAVFAAVAARHGWRFVRQGSGKTAICRLFKGSAEATEAEARVLLREYQALKAAHDSATSVKFTKEMLARSEVIAHGSAIRKIDDLVSAFGGTRKGWVKKKGWDAAGVEWHWYEHHGIGRKGLKRAGEIDPF